MCPTPSTQGRYFSKVALGDFASLDRNPHAEADRALARRMDARLIAILLAINPVGLGGVHVRASPGVVRDGWLRMLRGACPDDTKVRPMPAHAEESQLLGGLDLSATLRAGRPVLRKGLLSEIDGGLLLCQMAERLPRRVVAFLSQALDRGQLRVEREGMGHDVPTRFAVVALDESLPDDDEHRLQPALGERLAFMLSLPPQDWRIGGLSPMAVEAEFAWNKDDVDRMAAARRLLQGVESPQEVVSALVQASDALGVESARAPWWALQAARTLAALRGLSAPGAAEVRDAARLVLGPRATRLPTPPAENAQEGSHCGEAAGGPPYRDPEPLPMPSREHPPAGAHAHTRPVAPPPTAPGPATDAVDHLHIEAIKAALPAGLLALMDLMASRRGVDKGLDKGLATLGLKSGGRSSRAGDRRRHGAQGRPSGTKPGLPQGGHRLSLIDTLRQAAPWQGLRRASRSGDLDTRAGTQGAPIHRHRIPGVIVQREDLRIIRREPRRPTTTVFVVDASGSNALNRLAEAKGAVETMLADCYVRRDRVAVIGFRGRIAETLLPPTRSLVRAKRNLAGLPGGGGTPTALALTESRLLCESLQRRGDSVALVLLTDGKSNINLEGRPGREGAHADAVSAARQLFHTGVVCLLIDTSPKPQAQARELALAMGARYIPLPQAQAGEIGRIVRNSRAA